MRAFTVAAATILAQQSMAEPNILLVIADDMGVDVSPCHTENLSVQMPNLEALCAEGMVFENAYAAPVCSPSRATILTGRYGYRTGVGSVFTRSDGGALSGEKVSLFDRLNEANYASALIGKWHLTSDNRDLDHPADFGISYHFGPFSGGVRDYENWTAVENGRRVQVTEYATSALTDNAIDWLSEQKDPWFLWLAYNAPHTPFHLPPNDLHSFDHLTGTEADIRRNSGEYYFAALEALDSEFGRLMDSLSPDERAQTVTIFVGDNGTPTQALGRQFRGRAKGSLYEGGVNVPLVIGGSHLERGESDALVNTTDLFATILDFANTDPGAEDSLSLLPVLTGQGSKREYAYVERFEESSSEDSRNTGWAIRDDRYKLLAYDGRAKSLYDLKSDPDESIDLLRRPTAEHSAIAEMLTQAREALLQ